MTLLAVVKSTVLQGLEGQLVQVEVDVSNGLPGFDVVGLPDASVRESKDRVRAAIKNSDLEFPIKRITVNMSPADIRKEGPMYDLPIAAGILSATEQVDAALLDGYAIWGELSLNGAIRGVSGILPNVLAARHKGLKKVIVPLENADEAALVEGIEVYPVSSLRQFYIFFNGEELIPPYKVDMGFFASCMSTVPDMAEVRGQRVARRALEVAAAGGHNIIMIGSPGSGKTMLARRLPGILPRLTFEEALEVSKIHSLAGQLRQDRPLITERPFRAPHHSASSLGMIGGGRNPRPGEISLAHYGVLFLDEMPEFHRDVLECLRQPLEDGVVTISRVSTAATFPARIMLVGAMNPCPCGFFGDSKRDCSCTPSQIQRYMGRISGPLLDRFDIHVQVPRVEFNEIEDLEEGEPSARIKKRVEVAKEIQNRRFTGREISCNAQMDPGLIKKHCGLNRETKKLLEVAFDKLSLSARAHYRILKVARTIADLETSEKILEEHLAEAIQYRSPLESRR